MENLESRKCVIPVVCMKLGKWYLVKHNCVPVGVFGYYNGQLHVSACTGHLQVVLGELNLRSYISIAHARGVEISTYGPYLQQVKLLRGGVLGRYDGSVVVWRPVLCPSPWLSCVVGGSSGLGCVVPCLCSRCLSDQTNSSTIRQWRRHHHIEGKNQHAHIV